MIIRKRSTVVKYNRARRLIEITPRWGNWLALLEDELKDLGFQFSLNEDGYEVLMAEYSDEKLALVRAMLITENVDEQAQKPHRAEAPISKPMRVVYPLSAKEESAGSRKPTDAELKELSRIEALADEVDCGEVTAASLIAERLEKAGIKTSKLRQKQKKTAAPKVVKASQMKSLDDVLSALAGIKAQYA